MTQLHSHGVHLSKAQHQKIHRALKKGTPLSLRLTHKHLTGAHELHLTKTQKKRLQNHQAKGEGADLHLTHKQIMHSYKKGSGIFGSLLKVVAPLVLKPLVNAGADFVKNKIDGNGFFTDALKSVAKTVAKKGIDLGTDYVKNKIDGNGLITDFLKSTARTVAKKGVDFGSDYVKRKIDGGHIRKIKKLMKTKHGQGILSDILGSFLGGNGLIMSGGE